MANLQASSIVGNLTLNTGGPIKAYGGQEWTTEGAAAGQSVYIPYGGSYYTSIWYANVGYPYISARIYYNMSISQQHGGLVDFKMSRYGGGVTHTSYNTGYATWIHAQYASNANYYQCRLQNTNSASWGNGYMSTSTWVWMNEGLIISASPGNDDNYSSNQSGNWLRRVA